ncbi:heavy metal RND transporter [Paramesorhizobium deserti]|uniref:Heavy metal RND transporter n=1 Tax=Paramesorhizobium deserti TaxID=1494590 RepID=A0A135HNW3_9HYPH|nr:FixH family protein [Paramesorhizobium deserti]KXF74894.1 heavy metal RND transporter [Paramesorhizobium deserti]
MTLFTFRPAVAAALIGLTFTGLSTLAWAQIQDYEFQLVRNEIKQGNAAEIAVRLVDKRSGQVVPDAVIFAQRVDMAPDGMEMMAAPIEALPSTEPGIYRFKAQISMAGGWRLSLGAKVQGETDTLENKLEFKAVE